MVRNASFNLLAICLSVSLALHAQEYDAPAPPPPIYAPLVWRYQDVAAEGFWFSNVQVLRINARLDYLENRATQDCIISTNKATETGGAKWLLVGLSLAVGIGLGAFVARRF